MAFQVGSKIGVDLTQSQTAAQFRLGDRVDGSANSKWVYVYASGAVAAGDCVTVSATGTAATATAARVADPAYEIAFAQFALGAGEYGWVAQAGQGLTVAVSATASNNAVLYVATTAGKLSTTASSGTLTGVQIANVSSTATTTTTTGTLTFPKCITPGF